MPREPADGHLLYSHASETASLGAGAGGLGHVGTCGDQKGLRHLVGIVKGCGSSGEEEGFWREPINQRAKRGWFHVPEESYACAGLRKREGT